MKHPVFAINSSTKILFLLFLSSLLLYSLLAYGGVRSPDAEVVFRTAESLWFEGNFSVEEQLSWRVFGLPKGIDGKRYSLFGPLESILLVPFIAGSDYLLTNKILTLESISIPVSHYADRNILAVLQDLPLENPRAHKIRFLSSFYNVLISAITLPILYLLLLQLTNNHPAALLTSIAYLLTTPLLHYSGTMFSEPTTILLLLFSFFFCTKPELTTISLLASGLFAGLAVTSHISALLFLPFFALYLFMKREANSNTGWREVSFFLLGALLPLFILGWFNVSRFGSFFETGRSADEFGYGYPVPPWRGLFGLLLSSGKGLFVFCPIVLLSIISWPKLHKTYPILSRTIYGLVFLRIFFIASRSDWHGGFCLGPRLLLVLLPFLFIPLAFLALEFFTKKYTNKKLWLLFCFLLLLTAQQFHLSLGDPFLFYHQEKLTSRAEGKNLFVDDQLYLDWKYSPLLNSSEQKPSPFLGQFLPFSHFTLLLLLVIVTTVFLFPVFFYFQKSHNQS